MTLGLMLAHRGGEFGSGNEPQHLREDAAYSIHGGVLLWVVLDFLAETPLQPVQATAGFIIRPLWSGSLARTDDLPNLAVKHPFRFCPQQLLVGPRRHS